MSPCRSARELLLDVVRIFPGCKLAVDAGPLDQELWNRAGAAVVQASLENLLRNLKSIRKVWRRNL
jgi:hypothetical protein